MRKTSGAATPRISRQPLYQALLEVNLHFDDIRAHVERLRTLAVFRGRVGRAFFPAFDAAVSEARAWFNTELLEVQGEVESREWARLDLLRARREKSFRKENSPRRRPKPAASTK
jgi:hypothetical protein